MADPRATSDGSHLKMGQAALGILIFDDFTLMRCVIAVCPVVPAASVSRREALAGDVLAKPFDVVSPALAEQRRAAWQQVRSHCPAA